MFLFLNYIKYIYFLLKALRSSNQATIIQPIEAETDCERRVRTSNSDHTPQTHDSSFMQPCTSPSISYFFQADIAIIFSLNPNLHTPNIQLAIIQDKGHLVLPIDLESLKFFSWLFRQKQAPKTAKSFLFRYTRSHSYCVLELPVPENSPNSHFLLSLSHFSKSKETSKITFYYFKSSESVVYQLPSHSVRCISRH